MTLKASIKKIRDFLGSKPKPKPNREINFLNLYRIVGYVSDHRMRELKESDSQAPVVSRCWKDFHPTLSWEQDFEYAHQNEDESYEFNFDSYIKRLKVRIRQEGLEENITVEENPGKIFFRESGRIYHSQYKITVKDLRIKCVSYSEMLYFDSQLLPYRFFPKDSRRGENQYNGSIYIEFRENVFQSVAEYDHIPLLQFNLDRGIYAIFRSNVFERVSLSLSQRGGGVLESSFSSLNNNIFRGGFARVYAGDTYDSHNASGVWPVPYSTHGFRTKFENLVEQHAASILQDRFDERYEEGMKLRHQQIQERSKCPAEIAKIATSMCPQPKHGPIKIAPDDIEPKARNNNVAKILGNEFTGLDLLGNGAIVLAKNKINNFTTKASNIRFMDVQKIEYMYDYKSALGDLKKRTIETGDRQERRILEKQIYKIEQKNMKRPFRILCHIHRLDIQYVIQPTLKI